MVYANEHCIPLVEQTWWDSQREYEEAQANAALIAAAPLMYRMLELLVPMLRHLPEHGVGRGHDQVWPETLRGEARNIDNLLAKARGEGRE